MNKSPFDNALLAATRALEEVVSPAMDPANPLAKEQLALVLRYLNFIRARACEVNARQRKELEFSVALGERILNYSAQLPGEVTQELSQTVLRVQVELKSPQVPVQQLSEMCRQVNALICASVRYANRVDVETQLGIERAVLDLSKPVVALQRSWLSPLRLDPEPASIIALDSLLN